jgi:hypothetical protein
MTIVLATSHKQPALTPSDALLRAALDTRGVDVEVAPWDDIPHALPADTCVCLRATWDYHHRPAEFEAWIRGFLPLGETLQNPAETVLWNMDKRYLRELEAAGVRIPLTRWFEPGERADVRSFLQASGQSTGVIKPRISATAFGTHLVDREWAPGVAESDELGRAGCLLQAFVPEVQSKGEWSLIYIDGRFSHAVLKRAARGEFRVQMDFGGTHELVTPSPVVRAFGDAVLDTTRQRWIYARVDLVEAEPGPTLMELELIEPELFLTSAPGAADVLAAALVKPPREPAGLESD